MKKIFLILSLFVCCIIVNAQVDSEFWFAAPSLYIQGSDDIIKFSFVSYDQPTTITISQPANSTDIFPPIVINLEANSYGEVDLSDWKLICIENSPSDMVLNYGLHITSNNPISVYYAIDNGGDTETYTLKGKNALGNYFIVPMQYALPSGAPEATSTVEVVATENNTEVTFIPSQACVGHPKDTPFTIYLNRGQSYVLKAVNNQAGAQLRNTIVESDKPIVVNSSDDFVKLSGSKDLIGEQLVPVKLAGSQYIAVPNNPNIPYPMERVYIFPVENNTKIYVDGTLQATLNKGEEYYYDLIDAALFTSENDKPFIAFQVTGNQGTYGTELGATILPNLKCSGSPEVTYKSIFQDQQPTVTIVAKTRDIGNFTINGNTNYLQAHQFIPLSGDSTWSYCNKRLLSEIMQIKNTSGYFHIGVIDAIGLSNSFGYFSNFNTIALNTTTSKNFYVEGDEIQLSLNNASDLTNIQWTGPNGFFSEEINPVVGDVTKDNSGRYTVSATHIEGCSIYPDTMVVNVVKKQALKELSLCYGASENLTAEGYGPYTWTPAGLPDTKTVTISPIINTTYTVTNSKTGYNLILNGDFQAGNTNFISDFDYDETTLSSSGKYTVGSTPKAYNSDFNDIFDHTYGDTSGKQLIVNCNPGKATIWAQSIRDIVSGTPYLMSAWFFAADAGGTPVKFQFSINDVLVGDLITLSNDGNWQNIGYIWNGDSTTATIGIVTDASTTSGSSVCVDDIQLKPLFSVTDTFEVIVSDSLKPLITGDSYICNGVAQLIVDGVYESYLWNNKATTQAITVSEEGDYSVRVANGNCTGTGYFSVGPNNSEVIVSLGPISSICIDEPYFGIDYTINSGELGFYDILYDEKAKQIGFSDVENQQPTGDQFVISIPSGVRPDNYNAEIKVYEKNCGESSQLPLTFMIKYSSDLLTQRWNDVIGVTNSSYNGGYTFTAYQWYKNGELLTGQTKSYLYESESFKEGDKYSVLLTREDDEVALLTCDFSPELLTNDDINTIASPSQIIQLKNISESGTATFCSITGIIMSRQPVNAYNTSVQVPARRGMYILQVATGKEYKQYQILVN